MQVKIESITVGFARLVVRLVGTAALCAAGATAMAQPAPTPFNRAIVAVAATPDGPIGPATGAGPTSTVRAVWKVGVNPTSVALNVATRVELRVNGATRASQIVQVDIAAGGGDGCFSNCQGGCGSYSIGGGVFNGTLLCVANSPCFTPPCDCSCETPPITTPFPGEPLGPGDEITVILYPAPGALPEPDARDDTRQITPVGGAAFWDRAIEDVELVRTGPAAYDVRVLWDWGVATAGQDAHLATDVAVLVNGVQRAQVHACSGWIAAPGNSTCAIVCDLGTVCGTGGCGPGGVTLRCGLAEDQYNNQFCACRAPEQWLVIPAVAAQPGDEVTVLLRPAPGGLPELPGFEDDDEETRPVDPCPADLDGDGFVGAGDLAFLLGSWGTPAADLNGDNTTNAADLALMLGGWGPCFPV